MSCIGEYVNGCTRKLYDFLFGGKFEHTFSSMLDDSIHFIVSSIHFIVSFFNPHFLMLFTPRYFSGLQESQVPETRGKI